MRNLFTSGRPFRLVPYFFLLSLLLMAGATVLMAGYLRHYSSEQLLKLEKSRAASLVQIFENSLWADFRPLLPLASDPAKLKQVAGQPRLREAVIRLMSGTDVIRVKMYALNGVTLFSTDPKQIGEDENDDEGYRYASAGTPASELVHSHSIDAFERTLTDRDIISTYVPMHDPAGKIEGVLEVYLDATSFVVDSDRQLRWVTLAICALMAVLFLAQMLVVRLAGRIIDRQAAALSETNRELDNRVAARTWELANANANLEGEIQERRRAEEKLDHLAHHDPLTGLPNRLLFQKRLSRALSVPDLPAYKLAMLFIDLDRFKDVNDTLGHYIGDQLLNAVAARLADGMRAEDMLARLGGDEFICVLENIADRDMASDVAGKLLALFRQPFCINGNDLYLSASIGISFASHDGADVDTLLRHADIAMYAAKSAGRNRCQHYTPQMSAEAEQRVVLERQLRQALENDEITAHYQPQVDAATGKLVGAEALARWRHPTLGMVPPSRFIPIAEECGLIVSLGDQILEKSLRQLANWRRDGFELPSISVNLSTRQLERQDFPQHVARLLQRYQLQPGHLELEITESVIMETDNAVNILAELRALGIRLSIDDFGTGYSSLSYLRQLPVQVLKIDRSFILGIGKGGEAIVHAILALSSNLGLETVAEGVEEPYQLEFLRAAGCHVIQGFLYSRPLHEEAFASDWRERLHTPAHP
ncbi:putative bifunctional diguanylate cyclase/phosphodiesterase [Chromobacterium vaccinii]|uniref:putative bifunctional diguanylate cyclase/phosphodiesterase n=1 Tax=Chromobacterium vaccinii TaxID=1108595 RepID=UPI000E12BE0C|nr:EAL domain-containing protein [Chromobacterium vaccinii]SUX53512.1 Bacteriophytochrome cph2 [Chromobacterium vaccinii]